MTENFYLGNIDGVRRLVCQRHVPMLQTKPDSAGVGLRCYVCEELKSKALRKLHDRSLYVPEPTGPEIDDPEL